MTPFWALSSKQQALYEGDSISDLLSSFTRNATMLAVAWGVELDVDNW
jgi:hypothetical protein